MDKECFEEREELDEAICRLQAELRKGSYEALECRHVARELNKVNQRLTKGEYKFTDFSNNTFNVAERTREYFLYFESYFKAARTWARVLGALDVKRFSRIADLCPGWAPKVELALFYLQYQGTVILADKDAAAVEQNVSFMRLFQPPYDLEVRLGDVFDLAPGECDLVIANHLIDDLLLSRYSGEAGFDSSSIYREEQGMRDAWKKILARRSYFLNRIVADLVSLFSSLVRRGGCLILTQYQAYMERLLDLDGAVSFCKEAAAVSLAQLAQNGFSEDHTLTESCLKGFDGWFGPEECRVITRLA